MAGNNVISAVLTLIDQNFSSGMFGAANNADDLSRKVKATGNAVGRFSKSAVSSFKSVALGAAGMVAAYVGVNAIKDLGVSMIEASASAKAMNSQFEQVFAGMESAANSSLSNVANETGILSGRLKGSFLGIAAFAKTTGMDTENALKLTERATLAAADGAAFYDKSIEDVSASLQSFLKGNFENDAALGISATETTRNAAANKAYGKSFIKLSEDQKQMTLLSMVEDGNKLSGALGQAARETDGLENVLGNLRESWRLVKEKFGEPLLGPVISSMKELTDRIGKIDTDAVLERFKSFGDTAKNAFEKVKPVISFIKDTAIPGLKGEITALYETSQPLLNWMKDVGFPAIGDAIVIVVEKATALYSYIKDNWSLIGPVVAGVAATIVTLKVGMIAMAAVTKIWTAVVVASQIAMALFNGTLYLSPLGWVALAIGAVVAVGVALYKNWDTVIAKTQELWTWMKQAEGVVGVVISPIKNLIQTGVDLARNWDSTRGVWDNVWNLMKLSASNAVNSVIGGVNKLIETINSIPGVNIPLIANVSWGDTKVTTTKTNSRAKGPAMASFAVGTNRVSRDMTANIHKDEMIIPARQSRKLRNQGVTIDNIDKPSASVAKISGGGNNINININGVNKSTNEIISELVPQLKLALGNM